MNFNFKDIHIGSLINTAVTEKKIEIARICNFLQATEEEVEQMYQKEHLDSGILLRWSKLLEYDFFRVYSQHLMLYAPVAAERNVASKKETQLPHFKKNIYTKHLIHYILTKIIKGEMTAKQIIKEYRIPKTTLYKWISKYVSSGEIVEINITDINNPSKDV